MKIPCVALCAFAALALSASAYSDLGHSGKYPAVEPEKPAHDEKKPGYPAMEPTEPSYVYDYNPCDEFPILICVLTPTESLDLENRTSKVAGHVTFTPEYNDDCEESYGPKCLTRVAGTVTGLGDATLHGWHIHEFGNLTSVDGTATGGHYNPKNVNHSLPINLGQNSRHVGDLGNLRPAKDGVADIDFSIMLDTYDVLGRGVIVHAVRDDGGQPTGNAGARLSQCVLGRANL